MEELRIGERYLVDGYSATVVALPNEGKFDDEEFGPKFSVEDWLEIFPTGIVVKDDQAGLIHYPDLENTRIEPLKT